MTERVDGGGWNAWSEVDGREKGKEWVRMLVDWWVVNRGN
jgi:hypothetical protein